MNQPFVSGAFTFKVYISYSWCDDKLQCENNPHCFIPDNLNPKVVCVVLLFKFFKNNLPQVFHLQRFHFIYYWKRIQPNRNCLALFCNASFSHHSCYPFYNNSQKSWFWKTVYLQIRFRIKNVDLKVFWYEFLELPSLVC